MVYGDDNCNNLQYTRFTNRISYWKDNKNDIQTENDYITSWTLYCATGGDTCHNVASPANAGMSASGSSRKYSCVTAHGLTEANTP